MYSSAQAMIQGLSREGLVFSSSHQTSIGRYSAADVEWNYRDVPHLKEIHDQVEGIPGAITHDFWVGFFLQNIGPMKIPITVFNFGAGRDSNVYFGAVGPFALIISTTWQECENLSTTVTTTYSLGSSRFFRWMHGSVHKVLARNYKVLMKEDTPMRLRRGTLRDRGYKFVGDKTSYGFIETMNLQTLGVLPPALIQPIKWASELEKLPMGSTLVGSDDIGGVRLVRQHDKLLVFPRVCLHAGASLDDAKIKGDCIVCPWHGKRIQPLAVLVDTEPVLSDNSRGVSVRVENGVMYIDGSLNP